MAERVSVRARPTAFCASTNPLHRGGSARGTTLIPDFTSSPCPHLLSTSKLSLTHYQLPAFTLTFTQNFLPGDLIFAGGAGQSQR